MRNVGVDLRLADQCSKVRSHLVTEIAWQEYDEMFEFSENEPLVATGHNWLAIGGMSDRAVRIGHFSPV